MRSILTVVVLFLATLAVAQPVTNIQQTVPHPMSEVRNDSLDEELCRMEWIANFPAHGATHLFRVAIIIHGTGATNWNVPGVIDDTFSNLSLVNASGVELASVPVLSQCPLVTLTANTYTCEIAPQGNPNPPQGAPMVFSGLVLFRAFLDIKENAGRENGQTVVTHMRCGYTPAGIVNVWGAGSNTFGFAPISTIYGPQRPYVWRAPLLSDGFEN